MPHLTFEYSRNLDATLVPTLLRAANEALLRTGHFDEADIKSRALGFDDFVIGIAGLPRAFIAARLSMLSGRTPEAKRDIAQSLLTALTSALPQTGIDLQMSVEILDIDRDSYAKHHRPT